jgi:hypothetical protein
MPGRRVFGMAVLTNHREQQLSTFADIEPETVSRK